MFYYLLKIMSPNNFMKIIKNVPMLGGNKVSFTTVCRREYVGVIPDSDTYKKSLRTYLDINVTVKKNKNK